MLSCVCMQKVWRWALIVLVVAGTCGVLIARTPEERVVKSDDGLVWLSGVFASTKDLSIGIATTIDASNSTAVISSVYQLYPPNLVLSTPAVLTMTYPTTLSDNEVHQLTISEFDSAFGMWRPMDTSIDTSAMTVSTLVDRALRFALLLPDAVARPNMDAEIERLVSASPQGAVGYAMEVGYADVSGDFVIVPGLGKTGGCARQYQMGQSTQMTSLTQTFSDHLQYQVVAVWQIGDGCSGYDVIE